MPDNTDIHLLKRFFDSELDTFRSHLILMGEKPIEQVLQSVQSIVNADLALAKQVVANDDAIDALEIKIDDEAVRYMNMRAPIAADLRLLVTGMKISGNLERIGDEASNIAKRTLRLGAEPPLKEYIDIPRMGDVALTMLRDALDCFLEPGNDDKAFDVIQSDNIVDNLNRQIYRELSSYMIEDPATTSRALELMFVSKSIERIADHATNIAEEVIYLTQARDVRHSEGKIGI